MSTAMNTRAASPALPAVDRLQDPGDSWLGEDLVFVIGAMRSGTTLLRKVLDSHPQVHSPAETWFLLPLLDMWRGSGSAEAFNRAQAGAAIQHHLDRETFLACCRGFARTFYADRPATAACFVDKTPLYLSIADEIAALFPAARFMVLSRDPRSTLWSRATWQHASTNDPRAAMNGVVTDMKRLAAFRSAHLDRSHLVSYEGLCERGPSEAGAIAEFLGVAPDPGMLRYGDHAHHEGYGDEKSRAHAAPHTASVARWRGELDEDTQADLLSACGATTLTTLGLEHLLPTTANRAAAVSPGASGDPQGGHDGGRAGGSGDSGHPRTMFLMHPGTNSRDILQDVARGFRSAGVPVVEHDLAPVIDALTTPGAESGRIIGEHSHALAKRIEAEGIELTVGLWANGLATLAHLERDDAFGTFHDIVGVPHILFWLDSPERAQNQSFRPNFNTPFVTSPACFHWINNHGTSDEMTRVYGFANVASLAYGIDPEHFRPHDDVRPVHDIVFSLGAGAPPPTDVMRSELASDAPDERAIQHDLLTRVTPRVESMLLTRAPVEHRDELMQLAGVLLEIQIANRHFPMLDRLNGIAAEMPDLAPAIASLRSDVDLYADLTAEIRSLESWRRAFAIAWLARRHRCAIFGNPSLDGWEADVTQLGYVAHPAQSRAYASARLGLNVMRWQDDVGVNLKPLEISASGVACVTERRAGIEALLQPDSEIAVFDTMADLGPTVQGLLDDDGRRSAMAAAAHARVHAEHLWQHRAEALTAMVAGATAGTAGGTA